MGNENGFAIQMWYDRVRIELITKHKDSTARNIVDWYIYEFYLINSNY